MSRTVEVRGVIHGVAPLRGDDADFEEMGFDLVWRGLCRGEGGMVYDEGP